jgi:hypothetical protein
LTSMLPPPTSILTLIKVVPLLIIQSKLLWQQSGNTRKTCRIIWINSFTSTSSCKLRRQ